MDSVTTQIDTAYEALLELAVTYGMSLLGALVVLTAGWIIAGWTRRASRRALDRMPHVDETLKPLLASVTRYAILIVTILVVLAQFGIETTSLIAMLGAAGIAIALALQGTLSNVAASIMLLVLRPFKVGDYVDASGIAGTVDEIGLFTTQMRTYDGVYLMVPNAQLWNRAITNYSRLPTRRLDIEVGISYGDDVDAALAALGDLLANDGRVLADPPAQVMVKQLADSAVTLNLRCWANTGDFWGLRFDLTKWVKQRLDREGITIPFPQRDVHMFAEGGAPAGTGSAVA